MGGRGHYKEPIKHPRNLCQTTVYSCNDGAPFDENVSFPCHLVPSSVPSSVPFSVLLAFNILTLIFLTPPPPSASDVASDQGQVLVIVTAAVGGFTLLVILTLFLLITGR